jgi:hypothetical protein
MTRSRRRARALHADLYIAAFRVNLRSCRIADFYWQQARVYFLAFLNPLKGQPVPALTARLANLYNRR